MVGRLLLGVVLALGALAVILFAGAPSEPLDAHEAWFGSERAPDPDFPAVSSAPTLADSLRGSDVDGGLSVDGNGDFVPDREALALFDYFLSARGEVEPNAITTRIRSEIAARLGQPARDQALSFLTDYLAYRAEARELAENPRIAASGDLDRRFQWIRELRRTHFGAETAEALFGVEEAMVLASIESRRVALDRDLSNAERESLLAAIDETLPKSIRESRKRTRAPLRGWQHEGALRAAGASAAEIHDYRQRAFGPEAAARLAELDRTRQDRDSSTP